jgi:antitoxin (DNA-binding transcriptional repressor) of toxin-antitoxin stability system
MKKATLEKVQARLGAYVRSSAKQPVLILLDGEPVALLVGLTRNGKRAPVKLRNVLKAAWADYKEHGGIPHESFWEQLAKSDS